MVSIILGLSLWERFAPFCPVRRVKNKSCKSPHDWGIDPFFRISQDSHHALTRLRVQ